MSCERCYKQSQKAFRCCCKLRRRKSRVSDMHCKMSKGRQTTTLIQRRQCAKNGEIDDNKPDAQISNCNSFWLLITQRSGRAFWTSTVLPLEIRKSLFLLLFNRTTTMSSCPSRTISTPGPSLVSFNSGCNGNHSLGFSNSSNTSSSGKTKHVRCTPGSCSNASIMRLCSRSWSCWSVP